MSETKKAFKTGQIHNWSLATYLILPDNECINLESGWFNKYSNTGIYNPISVKEYLDRLEKKHKPRETTKRLEPTDYNYIKAGQLFCIGDYGKATHVFIKLRDNKSFRFITPSMNECELCVVNVVSPTNVIDEVTLLNILRPVPSIKQVLADKDLTPEYTTGPTTVVVNKAPWYHALTRFPLG